MAVTEDLQVYRRDPSTTEEAGRRPWTFHPLVNGNGNSKGVLNRERMATHYHPGLQTHYTALMRRPAAVHHHRALAPEAANSITTSPPIRPRTRMTGRRYASTIVSAVAAAGRMLTGIWIIHRGRETDPLIATPTLHPNDTEIRMHRIATVAAALAMLISGAREVDLLGVVVRGRRLGGERGRRIAIAILMREEAEEGVMQTYRFW